MQFLIVYLKRKCLNLDFEFGYLQYKCLVILHIENAVICPFIRKTCPCNVYPLEPHFYIAKLGYAKKNIKIFLMKIFIFYNFKNLCILHGHVFIMYNSCISNVKHIHCAHDKLRKEVQELLHYENLPMQYTENFFTCKN